MKQSLYAMIAVMVVLLAGLMAGPNQAGAQAFSARTFTPLATSNEVIYNTAGRTMGRAYANIRTISYAIGALGVVGLGIMCMFGKMQFQWLFMAIGGMALIALIDQAMGFIAGTEFTAGGAGLVTS